MEATITLDTRKAGMIATAMMDQLDAEKARYMARTAMVEGNLIDACTARLALLREIHPRAAASWVDVNGTPTTWQQQRHLNMAAAS